MKVYCPVCHKRYGQAKLKENEKVAFVCKCGTLIEVHKDRVNYIPVIKCVPLEECESYSVSHKDLFREVEAKLDLDIVRQYLSSEDNQLLDLMLEGKTQEEIANITHKSQATICRQFKNIQKKARDMNNIY